ncbi:hypothetical protein LJR219_003108 [Phenylobacterium sp. LjRoot219]|uniref:hypothetical protein n=1 Tax=Phenylobacterium sp. LjRoot219 TaxID=3342283 RepID=UPI003ECF8D84
MTLTAVAVALVAGPAAAESIRISTAGKAPEQVKAEVYKAAAQLCRAEAAESGLGVYTHSSCVKATVNAALASVPAQTKLAAR